ncbi:acyltransferase family protein [Cupriavidus necator]|uniref:acyltransferase family protein n=1 Tax=Cupriavidus necator TaxID=106590 RepID=UPI003ECE36DC
MMRVNVTVGYRADVDGLRALAVLLVVLCHAGLPWLSGGFVGVDVFFVISGFVVTHSLRRSLANGTMSFADFYVRRARRLLPALYAMMAAVLAFAILFLLPMDVAAIAKHIGLISLLVGNVYLARQTGYFDPAAEQQPLLHTWSLSVEEQFYLVLPLVLYLLRGRSVRTQTIVLGAMLAISLAASQWAIGQAHPGAYYLAHNRAFEFLVGVLLAYAPTSEGAKGRAFDLTAVGSLAVVIICAVMLTPAAPFPGMLALVPCLAVATTIWATPRSRLASSLLANRWVAALGRASYSVYLWHWPVLFALRRFDLRAPEWTAAGVVVSLAAGGASYRWIEQRFRYGAVPRRQAVMRFMIAPALAVACVVVVGKLSDGFLFAYPEAFRVAYAKAKEGTWDDARGKACWEQVAVTDPDRCRLGQPDAARRAVLWGDSHAYHLLHFVDRLGVDYRLQVQDVAFPMCPPIAQVPARAGDSRYEGNRVRCAAHNANVMRYLLADRDIDTVILSAVWDLYANGEPRADAAPNIHGYLPGDIDRALGETVGQLLKAGKRVVVFDDIPLLPMSRVNCPLYNRLWWTREPRDCTFALAEASGDRTAARGVLNRLVAAHPEISVVRTYGANCAAGRCLAEYGRVPLYRLNDYGHLSMEGSSVYYDLYQRTRPNELAQIFGAPPAQGRQLAQK